MQFQNYPFFYLMFLSSIISGIIAIIAWNRRNVRGSGIFSFYLFLIAWWSFFYGLEVTAIEPDLHLLYLKIEYLAIPWIPGFVILFALKFGGFYHLVNWKTCALFFSIPVFTFLSYFTNEYHHWYYQAIDVLTIDGLTIISITPGFMYHVLTSYILLSIVFCLAMFIYILYTSPRVFLFNHFSCVHFNFAFSRISLLFIYAKIVPRFRYNANYVSICRNNSSFRNISIPVF